MDLLIPLESVDQCQLKTVFPNIVKIDWTPIGSIPKSKADQAHDRDSADEWGTHERIDERRREEDEERIKQIEITVVSPAEGRGDDGDAAGGAGTADVLDGWKEEVKENV